MLKDRPRLSWSKLAGWNWKDQKGYSPYACNACWVDSNILDVPIVNQNMANGILFHQMVEDAFLTGEVNPTQIVYEPYFRQKGRTIDCVKAVEWLKKIGVSSEGSFEGWLSGVSNQYGFDVTGRYDYFYDGVVSDFKTCSKVEKAVMADDYKGQLCLYAYLSAKDGIRVTDIRLLYPEHEVDIVEPADLDLGEYYFNMFDVLLDELNDTCLEDVLADGRNCWEHRKYGLEGM